MKIKNSSIKKIVTITAMGLTGFHVFSASVTPSYDSFGNLSGATFGGNGNPTDPVAITTITDGGNTITLGMAAQQRYDNPTVGNNGAGTYLATPGSNVKGPNSILGALWNFDFYINIAGGGLFGSYIVDLYYDFDPGVGTDRADFGVLHLNSPFLGTAALTTVEGSENLLFGYLTSGVLGIATPPAGTFDPNASGEYGFDLVVKSVAGAELGHSAILVKVSSVPDTTSTALLSIFGLGGIIALGRLHGRSKLAID